MSRLWVFPGQGAQQPGMLHRLAQATVVQDTVNQACEVLGEDVLALDSEQALRGTRAVQLCLLIAGVGAARLLQKNGCTADFVAGLSIGAYPAAVVAGALAFDDALRLVALRGELMHNAYPEGYGMTVILGLELPEVERLLAQVNGPQAPVFLANINAERQLVIAGSVAAMQEVARRAKAAGASGAKRLAVSVPSHCPLLDAPARKLAEAFAQVEVRTPRLRYLSGTSARPIYHADKLRDDLAFNMCRVIDWRSTAETAFERGVHLQIEMPPGSVLTGLGRKTLQHATAIAFDGARLDSLVALSREEESPHS